MSSNPAPIEPEGIAVNGNEPKSEVTRIPPRTPDQERRRKRIIQMCVIAGLMGLFFLILPMLYRAHYDYLLWSEGFMERAFAKSFLSGHYEKLIEAPKPLWNMFWLLAELPNRLYLLIVIMIAGVFLLFQFVSEKVSGSVAPGIIAALLTVFAFQEVLVLFLNGSWTIPYLLFGLLFLLALLAKRWIWATVAIGLAGLIRPESWLLAVFLLCYIRHNREPLRWLHFLPLAAPFLWAFYDYRVSGDWLYSFKTTAAYAILTGLPGTNLLTFWPRLIADTADSTGVILLLYAVAGIVVRARNTARETKKRKALAVLSDPLLAVTLLPLIAAWIMSVQGNLIVMRRFFYLSISLLAFYAVLLGWEILKRQKLSHRVLVASAIAAPILLIGLFRLPGTFRDGLRNVKVTEAKMAAIPGLAEQLLSMAETPAPSPDDPNPSPPLDKYKQVFIPFRRYAQFRAFTNEAIASKFLSYREVSLAVTSTQHALMGEEIEPPAGSPTFVRELMTSGKRFADYLPALAVWIPDDEMHYIDAFSFDDPEYFHKNYIDHGRYGFRIIGSALDSLGLIYEVREISPEQIQTIIPPGEETPPEPTYRIEEPPGLPQPP